MSDPVNHPARCEVTEGWTEVIEKLEAFSALEADWDGSGAEKLDSTTVRYCTSLVSWLAGQGCPPASCVSPTVEGGLVFQWQTEAGRLELEVNSLGRVECMLSIRGQRPKYWVISWERARGLKPKHCEG